MSSMQTYTANPRTALGSKNAAKLRKGGIVPINVSRPGKESTNLQIDEKSAGHLAQHVVHLCKVDVEGKSFTALRSKIVKDVLTDRIEHIDLIEVDEQSEVIVDVAVVPDLRVCPGLKAGGILELRARKIKLQCKANAIPDSVPVDLSSVELGSSLTVEAVTLPAGTKLITPAKQLLLSVVITRGLKAADSAAATTDTPAASTAGTAGAAPAAAAPAKK